MKIILTIQTFVKSYISLYLQIDNQTYLPGTIQQNKYHQTVSNPREYS